MIKECIIASMVLIFGGVADAQKINMFKVRDDFGRKLEPKGNYILHGAGQRSWEFASYWQSDFIVVV